MNSILDHIGPEHIHSDPFHYLTTSEALDPGYYEALAANFPGFSDHPGMEKNNALIHMSGLHAFAGEIPVDPIWQDFMRVHYSTEFSSKSSVFSVTVSDNPTPIWKIA